MRKTLVVAAGLLAACQSTDPDKLLSAVRSPSVRTITSIASAQDRDAALRRLLESRKQAYERDPRLLLADMRGLQRDYQRLTSLLLGKASGSWGRKDARLPGRTHYVKYTQNYKSRAIVDFDAGEITVETVDEKDPRASLKSAIVTTLLTPDDPRAVDLFSDKPIELTSAKEPYLLGLVQDGKGRPIATPAQAEAFADQVIASRSQTREVTVQEGRKRALSVKIAMVRNFAGKQAEKYRPIVEKYAAQYKVSASLVYAIIRTESNFNPFAVSSAPAYGMMQLVPASGGREAFRYAKGRDEMPSRQYLFDAENNIELGTAYLDVLFDRQLDAIANPISREYCVISAYNTGPGNVLRAFHSDRVAAVNAINSLEPPGVYERLRTRLPYEETRQYLVKVVGYRRQYLSF
ncbi:MAG TPA: murein transglycosylase domain-containing protein [Burkholderiales bacterium]